jgi:hypothetical protein
MSFLLFLLSFLKVRIFGDMPYLFYQRETGWLAAKGAVRKERSLTQPEFSKSFTVIVVRPPHTGNRHRGSAEQRSLARFSP